MIREFHLADLLTLANGGSGTAPLFFAMDHVPDAGVGKLYIAGTPTSTSVRLVALLMGLGRAGGIGAWMLGGLWTIASFDLHPLVLLFVLSGSLMISKTLRIPKP